jgi:hypothetical protein
MKDFTRVCRIEPQAVGAWLKQTSVKSNFQHVVYTIFSNTPLDSLHLVEVVAVRVSSMLSNFNTIVLVIYFPPSLTVEYFRSVVDALLTLDMLNALIPRTCLFLVTSICPNLSILNNQCSHLLR